MVLSIYRNRVRVTEWRLLRKPVEVSHSDWMKAERGGANLECKGRGLLQDSKQAARHIWEDRKTYYQGYTRRWSRAAGQQTGVQDALMIFHSRC
jgi:hypothetical protein